MRFHQGGIMGRAMTILAIIGVLAALYFSSRVEI
jgi:hypothetical protein